MDFIIIARPHFSSRHHDSHELLTSLPSSHGPSTRGSTLKIEKTFHFVDATKVDRDARRRMKSYVMKGKNAGRKIHRPSRLGAARRPHPSQSGALPCTRPGPGESDALLAFSKPSWPIMNYRLLGSPYFTFSYSIQLTPHSLRVVDQCTCGSKLMTRRGRLLI
jgi:hypothetical protein